MRYLLLVLLVLAGCKSNQPSPIIQPIKDMACAVEKSVAGGIAQAVASSLTCAHSDVMQADLQAAFGNANMCAAPVPVPAPAPGVASAMAAPMWKTIGDVPGDALKPKDGMKAQDVKPMGIIGSIACPIAVNSAIGFLSNSLPEKWGCTGPNASFAALISAATAACLAAVPI